MSARLLSRRELAALRNLPGQAGAVHMQTVTKWEREGMPIAVRGRKGKPSLYRESDVRAWLMARDIGAVGGGQAEVARERARKERAQAVLAEQLAAARARELLPRDEVRRAWEQIVAAVRTALLSAPVSYSDRLIRAYTLGGAQAHEQAFAEAMREVLHELATRDTDATPVNARSRKAGKGRAA